MIAPAGRWDWWTIPLDLVKRLPAGLPGVVARSDGTFEVHRTHLPLLRQLGAFVGAAPVQPVSPRPAGITWRPWQERALEWSRDRRGALIVAEPRMGKTAMALALHDPRTGPLIVLAPLDVRQVWCDWIRRVFGEDPACLEGRKANVETLRTARFIFAHYDIVAHQQVASLQPGTLIVDEAHLLSNSTSKRSAGVRLFAGLAKRVVVLTGTPLWNSTKGLWPLLATANPGAWGKTPHLFRQRYCSPVVTEYGWAYGEISNDEEWLARRAEVVFQATWREERPDLEPTIRRFVDVPLQADEISEIDDAAAAMLRHDVEDTTIGAIARYRRITGRMKVTAAAAAAMAEPGPVVAWSWHKDVARALAKFVEAQGRRSFVISGEQDAAKRLAAIDAWRETDDGVLSATWSVGQVGLDFSHAPAAVVCEFDWTPAVLYQGEMRTFSPDRPMTVTYTRADHPVERMLVDKVLMKLDRAAASAMPAAGSGFHMAEAEADPDALVAALDALLQRTAG